MRNTLFHEEKHFVSVKETLCFFKRNTLFHKGKQIVSQRETDSETSTQSSQLLLSRSLVDLLSFEISLCDFATFARDLFN